MSKPKIKYIPRVFESDAELLPKKKNGKKATDVSANIYGSMLLSQAWYNLKGKQKELYLYCKLQYFAESKKKEELLTADERNAGAEPDLSKRFTMNKSKWCEIYHLYTDSTQRRFYEDMKALIEAGFIKVLETNQNTRKKNIYEFSDNWRKLGTITKLKKNSKKQ